MDVRWGHVQIEIHVVRGKINRNVNVLPQPHSASSSPARQLRGGGRAPRPHRAARGRAPRLAFLVLPTTYKQLEIYPLYQYI